MSTTLKEVLAEVESFKIVAVSKPKTNITEKYLGKFKGIIPAGKNSTQFIKELRSSLYGKVK